MTIDKNREVQAYIFSFLVELLKHLNLPKEETFVYGGGINDAEMIEFVNTGFVMGNAKEELKI